MPYPASVHVDQIYRTRANRQYCRERGIRLSGKPLGRPKQSEQAQLRKQAQADAAIRNQVEGKFGVSKRRFSLARVMAKLAATAETAIAMTFLVMNLERLLRQLLFCACSSSESVPVQPMAAAVARSSIRPGNCLSSSESQDLTVSLLKTREIRFQQALFNVSSG